ncbi:MAG: UDP-N-acetylglucosamine--N-acetylmuramyl-(pentapeptide) pyrophosphoryl-undecaprenol N-acetylglucosamine transferase [Planctomycetota bacterium]
MSEGPTNGAVLFAGGGSGGHIFPALAVAERIIDLLSDMPPACVFVISEKPLDARLLRDARLRGAAPIGHSIPARPFGASPGTLLRFMLSWQKSVGAARRLIRTLSDEHGSVKVVSTGGYVSAPVLRAARAESCTTTLVSLDAVPGKAGRFASRWADTVFTAEGSAPSSWERIRPVVRSASIGSGRTESREALGLPHDAPVLFVSGGSQGARSINELMSAILTQAPGLLTGRGWSVLHQSGDEADEGLRALYERAGVHAIVRPVFHEVGLCWGAADAAIGRAGAGTVGEVWANAVPTLFFPYPYHADDHQRLNARPLVEAGACEVLDDTKDGARNLVQYRDRLDSWLIGKTPSENAASFGGLSPADGADAVAASVVGR